MSLSSLLREKVGQGTSVMLLMLPPPSLWLCVCVMPKVAKVLSV